MRGRFYHGYAPHENIFVRLVCLTHAPVGFRSLPAMPCTRVPRLALAQQIPPVARVSRYGRHSPRRRQARGLPYAQERATVPTLAPRLSSFRRCAQARARPTQLPRARGVASEAVWSSVDASPLRLVSLNTPAIGPAAVPVYSLSTRARIKRARPRGGAPDSRRVASGAPSDGVPRTTGAGGGCERELQPRAALVSSLSFDGKGARQRAATARASARGCSWRPCPTEAGRATRHWPTLSRRRAYGPRAGPWRCAPAHTPVRLP